MSHILLWLPVRLSFCIWFSVFKNNVPRYGFWGRGDIYPFDSLWFFLTDGLFVVCCQFWKAFAHYFFKYFFCSILYSFCNPLMCVLHIMILLSSPWMFLFLLLLFLESFFYLCISVYRISTGLSYSSLILSSHVESINESIKVILHFYYCLFDF